MYELLRAALRQRPEYLLVGEVRVRSPYAFQAMSTGIPHSQQCMQIRFQALFTGLKISISVRGHDPALNIITSRHRHTLKEKGRAAI